MSKFRLKYGFADTVSVLVLKLIGFSMKTVSK